MRHPWGLKPSILPRFAVREKADFEDGIMSAEGLVQMRCSQPPRTRPRPARRRRICSYLHSSFPWTLALTLLVLLSSCCATAHAANAGTRLPRTHPVRTRFVSGDIIFDDRPAPQPALYRRAETSSIAAPTQTKESPAAAASSTASSSSSATSIESSPTDSTAPLPRPFDGGLGTNYTQPSCPTFLKSMISNDSFTSCLPFSLLVQVSSTPPNPTDIATNINSIRTPCLSSPPPNPSPP